MLRVMTWFWQQPEGRATYTADHVNIWAAMVRRHLTIPHRLAVVTDVPGDYGDLEVIEPPRDFEDVRIPTWGPSFPQCLRRLAMFAPDAGERFGERFVSMDMDCVVSGNLDVLFDTNVDFKIYAGTSSARPYNGSMVMMTAGARPQVYTEFSPEGAVEAGKQFVGSDQAWISYCLGWGEQTWGADDGVLWYGSSRNANSPEHKLMFFPGSPKPWALAEAGSNKFVFENYRGERAGRCLVLGYGPTLWADAEKAFEDGTFEAVISSPEAAKHWPGDILAIARDDLHAERLAHMHGFDEIGFCGRSEREAA
jgi:hypothetical protein